MATCLLHSDGGQEIPDVELFDHLRLLHPDVWGDGPERWPDGRIVVYDTTLAPGDFGGPRKAAPAECVNCDVESCEGCWGADTYRRDDWRP